MRNLLIVTQKLDESDPILGFFVRWVEEFAKHTEKLTVICLSEGKHNFPENVKVLSLGKEKYNLNFGKRSDLGEELATGKVRPSHPRPFLEEERNEMERRERCGRNGKQSRLKLKEKINYLWNFYKYIWQERKNYDSVFVHMNPEYIVLGGKLWRLLGKRVALWYTHKNVDWKLRIAVLFANVVFTASPESFRLKSKKVKVMGHGIDMEQFSKRANKIPSQNVQTCIPLHILTTGRISETKRIMEMLHSFEMLSKRGQDFTFTIAGAPATRTDREYEKRVRNAIANSSYASNVHFLGALAHKDIPDILSQNNIFLNLSTTGSMDKAVLEALAIGMPVVTTNIAFRDLLSPTQGLFITEATPEKIINALVLALTSDVSAITKEVRERYALSNLVVNISAILDNI